MLLLVHVASFRKSCPRFADAGVRGRVIHNPHLRLRSHRAAPVKWRRCFVNLTHRPFERWGEAARRDSLTRPGDHALSCCTPRVECPRGLVGPRSDSLKINVVHVVAKDTAIVLNLAAMRGGQHSRLSLCGEQRRGVERPA